MLCRYTTIRDSVYNFTVLFNMEVLRRYIYTLIVLFNNYRECCVDILQTDVCYTASQLFTVAPQKCWAEVITV